MQDFSELYANVVGVTRETQIKLGETEGAVSLYYPASSLRRLLDLPADAEVEDVLRAFAAFAESTLGNVKTERAGGDRFCLTVPPEGVRYVRERYDDGGFLREFVSLVQKNGSEEEFVALFRKFSPDAVCEKANDEEFDVLMYFPDGKPDGFRYCLKFEGDHVHYHRFTPKDFLALTS